MFAVLGSGVPIPVPGTSCVTYDSILAYFPFEALLDLTSPPTSIATIPWNVAPLVGKKATIKVAHG